MQFQVEKLSQTRLDSLKRLSFHQNHKIKGSKIQYEIESYVCLKYFFHFQIIRLCSLGQLIIIIFNTINHLLKVQQNTTLSKITLENIFINKELKIMFTNLHEETNEQLTYLQNINNLIDIFYKLFIQYQESLKQQLNDDNQFILSKRIQITNIYSNKILSLLKSDKHFKQLKQFILESIQDQRINDEILDDQVITKNLFESILEQKEQLNFNNFQSENNNGFNIIQDYQQNESDFKLASISSESYIQKNEVRVVQHNEQNLSNHHYQEDEPKQNQAIEYYNEPQLTIEKLISTPTYLPPSNIKEKQQINQNFNKNQSEIQGGYNILDKQNDSSCIQVPIQSDLYPKRREQQYEANSKNQLIPQPVQLLKSQIFESDILYLKEGSVISNGTVQPESQTQNSVVIDFFQ